MLKFTLLVFIAVSALAFANSLPGEKSKKYCRETHVAKSGRVRRIIGGEIAAPNEFPHTVALIYIENGKRVWNCAGILITDKYVLTGATCIDMYIPEYARLGEIVKTDFESDDSNFVLVNISRVIKHPKFDENKILNDIGLIELESKVKFNDYIKPACLNTENAKSEADSFIATGWGKTEHVSKSSSLLKVTLDEIVSAECAKIYKNKVKIDVEKHICTKSEKKDTCLGDSGGPLQKLNPNYISTYDIYGIISFGAVKCGSGFPSVSTRVSYYIDWIESIVFANDAKK